MRVPSLRVENLMTFGDFDLRLDGQRCTVVGPNGAGKSNIVRVVDLVRVALDSVRLFQPELAGQGAGVGGAGGARAGGGGWAQFMIVCQRVVCWRVRTSRARSRVVALPGSVRRRVRLRQFLRGRFAGT